MGEALRTPPPVSIPASLDRRGAAGWAPGLRLPPGLPGITGEEAGPLLCSRSGDSYRLLHRELAATVVSITNGCGG